MPAFCNNCKFYGPNMLSDCEDYRENDAMGIGMFVRIAEKCFATAESKEVRQDFIWEDHVQLVWSGVVLAKQRNTDGNCNYYSLKMIKQKRPSLIKLAWKRLVDFIFP